MSLRPRPLTGGMCVPGGSRAWQTAGRTIIVAAIALTLNAPSAMAFGERIKEGASSAINRGREVGAHVVAPKCSAAPDFGGCPFKGPRGNVLFSRCAGPRGRFTRTPTPLGNQVCDAVLSAHSLVKELGANSQATRRKVKAGMQERLERAQKGALSANLPNAVASAKRAVQAIGKDLKQYADDPVCGIKGTINNAKAFFKTKVRNAKTFAELGAKSARALGELTLASAEAARAKHAARSLRRDFPRNAKVSDQIFAEVSSFDADVQAIAKPWTVADTTARDTSDYGKEPQNGPPPQAGNPPNTGTPPNTGNPPSGGGSTPPASSSSPVQSAKLWPFMIGVGSCIDGMVSLGRAAFNYTMAGSGAFMCPETAGASCVAAGVATVNGTLKAVKGVVLAVGGCVTTVYDWRNNKDAYEVRWHEIVGRGVAVATRVHTLRVSSAAAPQRVTTMSSDLDPAAQRDAKSVVDPMNRAVRHLDSWRDIENSQIRPLLTKFGDSRWAEFSRNVGTVVTCSSKAGALTKKVGGQAGAGLTEIGQAAEDMKAVETARAKIDKARERALRAADSRAQGAWKAIRGNAGSMYERLLGVGYGAPLSGERVGKHLAALIKQPGQVTELANQAKELRRQVSGIAAGALKQGEDNFESAAGRDLDTLRDKGASALREFTSGAAKLRSAGWH